MTKLKNGPIVTKMNIRKMKLMVLYKVMTVNIHRQKSHNHKLPFTDHATDRFTPNPDNTITLTVSTPSPRYRFYAKWKQIRKMGYDPTVLK